MSEKSFYYHQGQKVPKRMVHKQLPKKGQVICIFRHDWRPNQTHYTEIIKVIDVYPDFFLCQKLNFKECFRKNDFCTGRYTFDILSNRILCVSNIAQNPMSYRL